MPLKHFLFGLIFYWGLYYELWINVDQPLEGFEQITVTEFGGKDCLA